MPSRRLPPSLGVEQIDLFILHQPLNGDEETYALEAYRALETLYADGRVRAIGVSNFLPHHLDRLLDGRTIVPAVNQIEVHPYFRNSELLAKHEQLGIVSQAWSPLGGITFYPGWGDDARRSTLEDPTIGQIAHTHDVTAAQVMLRWHVQQGRQVIPKSVTPARIAQNMDVFGFTLSDAEPRPDRRTRHRSARWPRSGRQHSREPLPRDPRGLRTAAAGPGRLSARGPHLSAPGCSCTFALHRCKVRAEACRGEVGHLVSVQRRTGDPSWQPSPAEGGSPPSPRPRHRP
ncbi:hypothetical protein GCM10025876_05560 [Demequina litorisediminis]|uniref:NADP-dependent oxidoreductase domain-containing protein n=1 Tax=Demequina litorisediminis TaxID=1849022 RepID=A0ABQ6IB01_9MICO|nr:hypothetical protein GCM10025876_05560 [Demequina litorisediminis]